MPSTSKEKAVNLPGKTAKVFTPERKRSLTNQTVDTDISFNWDIGEPPLRWYRVQGCCNYPTAAGNGNGAGNPNKPFVPGGCDVIGIQTDDAKCTGSNGKQQFIQNILATSVTKVCEELKKSKLKWDICSVKRWSRPADPTLVDPNDNCNKLEEVPYQQLPECLELSVTNAIIFIGAKSSVIEQAHQYEGYGIIETGGAADTVIKSGGTTPTTGSWSYASAGGPLLLSGDAQAYCSWSPDLLIQIGASSEVQDESVYFGITSTNSFAGTPENITTNCASCTDIPSNLFIQHNLNSPGVLYNFLHRNNLSFPDLNSLLYNAKLQTWAGHQHFVGLSEDNLNDERWRFTFDWGCTDDVGSESAGNSVIKFSLIVVKKNMETGMDFDTRLMITFPSDALCAAIKNFSSDLIFNLNVKTLYIDIFPKITPDSVILHDNIGLFKSAFWYNNPFLTIRITKNNIANLLARKDLSVLLPQQDTLLQKNGVTTNSPILV